MSQTYKLTISESQSGERLDKVFSSHFEGLSRSFLQKYGIFKVRTLGESGLVEKNYKTKAKQGEAWELEVQESFDAKLLLEPWDHPLEILQETDHWVAINKPIGVSVHPSASEKNNHTIVNALLHHYGKDNLSSSFEEVDGVVIPRLGMVHRLDKPTSGVLLVAKDNPTHAFLQEHWTQTEKTYYAVVVGNPPKKGYIEGAITRDAYDRMKMSVSRSHKAKEAQTSFENLGSWDQISGTEYETPENKVFSVLRVQIHTGRTHQIRVHLNSIGFPIVGDGVYGENSYPRLMLHAQTLKFPDPQNPEKMIEVVAPLPKEFKML